MTTLDTSRTKTARVNNDIITVLPKETVLQAALRQGIGFPHSCQVGGCATCKCRLVEGEVKELTDTGYLLSAAEIDQGTILACQSVPKTDIRIEFDLSKTAGTRVSGRVVAQEQVTHDISHLLVQLDEPLKYQAGQFANLTFDACPGVSRSYSFATPSRDDGKVGFYIRKVPGGQVSTLVNDEDMLGQSVQLEGPSGNFWLRASDAPIMMVAGGSGLPPILAMLEEAVATQASRSVTLLFGAREAKDLYALEQIESLRRRWKGPFRFVPVLSNAADDASWQGDRGLVTEKIPDLLEMDSHAYLCGPPAMIDAAIDVLQKQGVARDLIHFDRFTTQGAMPLVLDAERAPSTEEAVSSPIVNVFHYLKYFLFHALGFFAVVALLAGGKFITAGLLSVLAVYMIGDALGGDDTTSPEFRHPGILTAQLWLALPLLSLIVFTAVWGTSDYDPLGFGAWITSWSGYDVLAARDATGFGHRVSAWLLTGLMIGMVGTIPGHELTHRTWDPVSLLVGRWLLAFSFDTSFAIEHVYGHHRYVSTTHDPATAPRGRNVYAHIIISTIRGNISAFRIEADRLAKKRLPLFSIHNAFLRGQVMSIILLALAYGMGGVKSALFFAACALWGKALLEIVNYMEHYGMVRNPETPVQPRHSWNTNRRISSWAMFNLTRHSHHHAQGHVAYQDLQSYPDAPMMLNGYLTTIVIALIPPLWHHLMTPKVLAWDRDYANDEERALANAENQKSGFAALGSAQG